MSFKPTRFYIQLTQFWTLNLKVLKKKIVCYQDVFKCAFCYVFVVLIIKCVFFPNLSISSSIYICNSSTFLLATLFLIFTSRFQEGLKKVTLVNLTQHRGKIVVFTCQKYVCANSSNLFSDKLFPKLSLQSLLGLLLTNSIFLNLLFFGVTVKNVKAKVRKSRFYQAEPYITQLLYC